MTFPQLTEDMSVLESGDFCHPRAGLALSPIATNHALIHFVKRLTALSSSPVALLTAPKGERGLCKRGCSGQSSNLVTAGQPGRAARQDSLRSICSQQFFGEAEDVQCVLLP